MLDRNCALHMLPALLQYALIALLESINRNIKLNINPYLSYYSFIVPAYIFAQKQTLLPISLLLHIVLLNSYSCIIT